MTAIDYSEQEEPMQALTARMATSPEMEETKPFPADASVLSVVNSSPPMEGENEPLSMGKGVWRDRYRASINTAAWVADQISYAPTGETAQRARNGAVRLFKKGKAALKSPWAQICLVYLVAYSLVNPHNIQRLLSPACKVPMVSGLLPLQCSRPQFPDYLTLVELQTRFERSMHSTLEGSGIVSIELKNSQVAIRDLNSLAKVSNLDSKEELSHSIESFVGGANQASRILHRINAGFGGAIDGILAIDRYVLRALESAAVEATSSRSVIGLIFPSVSTPPSPSLPSRAKLVENFNQAAGIMETHLRKLIIEAEAAILVLDELERLLDLTSDITARESKDIRVETDKVLSELWTKLGGNKAKLRNYNDHKSMLGDIASYRMQARKHVATALSYLQQLSADLDELRDRVSRPTLFQDDTIIPLEAHIETIRMGVKRLEEGRMRATARSQATVERMLGE